MLCLFSLAVFCGGAFLMKKSSPQLFEIIVCFLYVSEMCSCIIVKLHRFVETSFAYSDFLLCKKSVIRSTVSPLRKKSRSAQLLVCKRTRYASLSLPTFAVWNSASANMSPAYLRRYNSTMNTVKGNFSS